MNRLACPTKALLDLYNAMCLRGCIVRTYPVSQTWEKYSAYKILKGRYSSHGQKWQYAPLWFRLDGHLRISGGRASCLTAGDRRVSWALLWGPFLIYKAVWDIWPCALSSMGFEFTASCSLFSADLPLDAFPNHPRTQHLRMMPLNPLLPLFVELVLGCGLGGPLPRARTQACVTKCRSARPGPQSGLEHSGRKWSNQKGAKEAALMKPWRSSTR